MLDPWGTDTSPSCRRSGQDVPAKLRTLQSHVPDPGLHPRAPRAKAPPPGPCAPSGAVRVGRGGGGVPLGGTLAGLGTHLPISVDQDSPEALASAPAVLGLPHERRGGAVGHSRASCPHLGTQGGLPVNTGSVPSTTFQQPAPYRHPWVRPKDDMSGDRQPPAPRWPRALPSVDTGRAVPRGPRAPLL